MSFDSFPSTHITARTTHNPHSLQPSDPPLYPYISVMFSRLAPRVLSRVAASAKPSFSASPLARPTFAAVARPSTSFLARAYSEADERLTVKNVEIRILDIFRTFDKVNQDNVRPPSPRLPPPASSTVPACSVGSVRSASLVHAVDSMALSELHRVNTACSELALGRR